MRKIGAFFARITKDDLKVNAFYDVGLRIFLLLLYILDLPGAVSFVKLRPYFIFFVFDILLALAIFFVLGVTNHFKRWKTKNLDNLRGKHAAISSNLLVVGILQHLLNTFIFAGLKKIPALTIISIILIIGSTVFYMIGYRQAKKNLHYEKIA